MNEQDQYIQDKIKVLDTQFGVWCGVTRKIAEIGMSIREEALKNWGLSIGETVFKEIVKQSRFGKRQVSYIKALTQIPARLYEDAKDVGIKAPADFFEEKGYSKFKDIAELGSKDERKKVLEKILDKGKFKDKDIKEVIREVRGINIDNIKPQTLPDAVKELAANKKKQAEIPKEKITSFLSPHFNERIWVNWEKRSVKMEIIDKEVWKKELGMEENE